MIDFKNGTFVKLKQVSNEDGYKMVQGLLISDEGILSAYRGIRDYVIFTNKRVISVNVQGVTGKKRDFTSMPYSKISVYSVETSGVGDLDSELDFWYGGWGHIRFEFTGRRDSLEIGRLVASYALR